MTEPMEYFPAAVEMREAVNKATAAVGKVADEFKKVHWSKDPEHYLRLSNGRRACPHPQHRFATIDKSPARVILPECAGRERWLAARHEGIGGSEVAALVGASEYETAWSIWEKKVNRTDKDLSDVAAVEWGHRLEGVVAEKVAEEIGMVSRFAGGLWANPDKPHLRVTPDRFFTAPRSWKARGVIECKTAGDDAEWESGVISPSGQTTGRAPTGYQAQLQWQLGILGLEVGYLGCYVSNRERSFFTVEVHFDKAWFDEMTHAADTLWREHVMTGDIPMHDLRHPKTEEMLKRENPVVVKPAVDLPEGSDEWLRAYWRAKTAMEKAEADLNEAKNFFRMWTGDAGAGYLGEKKVVSYPSVQGRLGVDVGMLQREYPEIAEKVTVRGAPHRRLTISVPKEFKEG